MVIAVLISGISSRGVTLLLTPMKILTWELGIWLLKFAIAKTVFEKVNFLHLL
jgi:hypothetical protein